MRKKNSQQLQRRFPDTPVTPIAKIEFSFNQSKNPSSQNDFMRATQFPLKVAFACTAHKMQGSTVLKPDPLVIDLQSVREAAQAYVMMSRVQALNQLYILDKFPNDKIYPSALAMEELDRLKGIKKNEVQMKRQKNTLVVTLNIRSLQHNHTHLLKDAQFQADVIALQETWCSKEHDNLQLSLPGYQMHLVSEGRGKGIATYFKSMFKITGAISKNLYQLSKVSCQEYDVINIYCSRGANKAEFLNDLGSLARGARPCFILGDFNINYFNDPKDMIIRKITSCGFDQLVEVPTHKEGGLLDHVYTKKLPWKVEIDVNHPYYSDHAAISIVKWSN